MGNRYAGKKIKNLRDLQMEQARIKHAYRDMEQNWSSLIPISSIATDILQATLKKKKKEKEPRANRKGGLIGWFWKKNNKNKKHTAPKTNPAYSAQKTPQDDKPPYTKKSYKKLGKNFLIWESVSIALFVGANIYFYFRKKGKK